MASIAVCNIALAEIRASPIVDLEDGSPEADACAHHYPDCFNTLIESHDWGFARRRVALSPLTNDRPGDWAYAYAVPPDLAIMGDVVPVASAPQPGLYFPWPYSWPRSALGAPSFIFDGEVIYTDLANAWIEYTSNDVDEGVWPAMFRRALTLDLASRLAITIRDDRAMKGDLIQQYEVARQRAIADDLNRQPRRDALGLDEVARVRV